MDTKESHLEIPERYDDLTRMALPHYEMYYQTIVEFIPKTAGQILELASGTGFLTSRIRKKFNQSRITCCDINPLMIAQARQKPELASVTFVLGDITKMIPDGRFDAVIISQCLFAVPREELAGIFARIRNALVPGGVFVYGDLFEPSYPWEMQLYVSHWSEQMKENGMDQMEIELMLGPLDTLISGYHVPYVRENLIQAGFLKVIIPYWYEMYGIVVGYIR